tara:strand:- start:69 stop:830 length:762 start_codon:yes stop_codon:yes gene_type:complete
MSRRILANFFSIFLPALFIMGCVNKSTENRQQDLKKVSALNTELGFRYMQEQEYDLANKKIEKALTANPKNPEAHNAMGLLKNVLGKPKAAESSFARAAELSDNGPAISNNYGQFLCQRGRHKEGIKHLNLAAINPLNGDRSVPHLNLGKCYKELTNYKKAEFHLKKSLSFSPKNKNALIELANIMLIQGQFAAATSYFDEFASSEKHSALSLWVGYQLAAKKGDLDSRDSFRLLLMRLFPNSPESQLLNAEN